MKVSTSSLAFSLSYLLGNWTHFLRPKQNCEDHDEDEEEDDSKWTKFTTTTVSSFSSSSSTSLWEGNHWDNNHSNNDKRRLENNLITQNHRNNDDDAVEAFQFHYSIFCLYFMIGFMVHSRRLHTQDFLVSSLLTVRYLYSFKVVGNIPALREGSFLLFLLYCIYSTYQHSPQNANHTNVCGFISVLLVPQQLQRTIHHYKLQHSHDHRHQGFLLPFTTTKGGKKMMNLRSSGADHPIIPKILQKQTVDALHSVRITILIMYFMAGFHKLDTDFLNIQVSCAYDTIWKYFLWVGWANPQREILWNKVPWILQTLPYQVLCIEMIPPLLLFFNVKSCRRLSLMTLISLHMMLLPFGFADFGFIAQSLLLLFVHPSQMMISGSVSSTRKSKETNQHPATTTTAKTPKMTTYAKLLWWWRSSSFREGYLIHLACTMTIFQITSVVICYLTNSPKDNKISKIIEFVLVGNIFTMIWTLVLVIPRRRYPAPATTNSVVPYPKVQLPQSKLRLLAIGFFVWYTFNPYLGLRTAGTLTMFSNLKTEGTTSNHLLLGPNPLKVFPYQEDMVHIVAMDSRLQETIFRNVQAGDSIPRITFDNNLLRTKQEEYKYQNIFLWIEYNGTTYQGYNVLQDVRFQPFLIPRPLWQRKYMLFRKIQSNPEEPQKCYW